MAAPPPPLRRKAGPTRKERHETPDRDAQTTDPSIDQTTDRTDPSHPQVRRVLVVEDDPTFAKLLTQILRTSEEGRYRTTVTDTMRGAIDLLEAEAYDVIIADLGLPDSREYDTIETLTSAAPQVPLVILTGTAGEGVGPSLEAVRRGASYFLRKGSVDAAAVERGIHYATERKQLSDILDTRPAHEEPAS